MTGVASPVPILQFFNNLGQPNVGGTILTQVGGVNMTTYQDVGQTIPLPNPIPLNSRGEVSNASGLSCQLFLIPNVAYTFTFFDALGNQLNQAPYVNGIQLTQAILGGLLYPQTTAELAASITPTNFFYPTLNILRYGGDNTGTTDNAAAFQALFKVMLQLGGAAVTLPPGKYNLASSVVTTITPTGGPNNESFGFTLYAYGVAVNYTGATGYAFDFLSPNTLATFYNPLVAFFGMNVNGNATAAGAFRINDISGARFVDCKGQGFPLGPAFTLRTTSSWCENDHFLDCMAVNCLTGIAFINTLTPPSGVSFARTTVTNFFGAGITNYWFDIGAGCAVYDSRFTHICGNFGSIAYFGIGAPGAGASMQATVIDGVDAEWDGNPGGFAQSIIRLRDYPQASGAPRPILYNVGSFALFTGGTPLPIWSTGAVTTTATTIAVPELSEQQALTVQNALMSTAGQSSLFEPAFNVAAVRNAATLVSGVVPVTMTGYASPPTGNLTGERSGNLAVLRVSSALTGTSNSTALTMTITNPEFMPSLQQNVPVLVEDNTINFVPAMASIGAPSTYASVGWTTTLLAGATSATLSAPWTNPTGVYLTVFSDSETRPVTFTNGVPAAIWTVPLSGTPNTGVTVQCSVVTFFIATAFNTYSASGFTATGTKGLNIATTLTYSL